jgi:hypothetical protein
LYLSDLARTWLEHLPKGKIKNWSDLKEAFMGNFQGTYVQPKNPWDLLNYRQKKEETLWENIRHFSKQCNELPDMADGDVISVFLSGMTCEALVHKLGRKKPKTTKELFDIATNHASGEEAIGAIFRNNATKNR